MEDLLLVLDRGREAGIVRRVGWAARRLGIPEESVRQLFWLVLELCGAAVGEESGDEGWGESVGPR